MRQAVWWRKMPISPSLPSAAISIIWNGILNITMAPVNDMMIDCNVSSQIVEIFKKCGSSQTVEINQRYKISANTLATTQRRMKRKIQSIESKSVRVWQNISCCYWRFNWCTISFHLRTFQIQTITFAFTLIPCTVDYHELKKLHIDSTVYEISAKIIERLQMTTITISTIYGQSYVHQLKRMYIHSTVQIIVGKVIVVIWTADMQDST